MLLAAGVRTGETDRLVAGPEYSTHVSPGVVFLLCAWVVGLRGPNPLVRLPICEVEHRMR